MPRRRKGQLIAIEVSILEVAAASLSTADGWLHGYALAKQMADAEQSDRLTSHGTLYKALGRLADSGMLESRWEDPDVALAEGRPRRRLYRITGLGQRAIVDHAVTEPAPLRPGVAPS